MNTKSERWSADIAAQTMALELPHLSTWRTQASIYHVYRSWRLFQNSFSAIWPKTLKLFLITEGNLRPSLQSPVLRSAASSDTSLMMSLGQHWSHVWPIWLDFFSLETFSDWSGWWCVPMVSAAICVADRNLSRRCVCRFARSCAAVITHGRPDLAWSLLEPVMP